nr:hypothetical protein [Tanacetum cinerariifolium]
DDEPEPAELKEVIDADDDVVDVVAHVTAELTPPSPTIIPPPPQQEVTSTLPPSPHQSPIAPSSVKRLKKKKKLRVSGLKRLKKVGTTQRVESSVDTVMDDQEDASKQGGIIELINTDEDVTLEDAETAVDDEVEKNADVQGRLEESQAQVYHIDLEHVDKVLSMHDDETEPTELKEVIEVVTTAKLMTEVVTATTAPITVATITAAPSAARRRKRVVIRDPEKTATPSTMVHSEPKSKDKGKGILVEEPKPLKKQ